MMDERMTVWCGVPISLGAVAYLRRDKVRAKMNDHAALV